jgi:hypothetical protein
MMKSVVIYESMYGNTHLLAEAIASGLAPLGPVRVASVNEADADCLRDVGLVVVGGPTHVHGMSRSSTRKAAIAAAEKPGSGLVVERDAEGPGLREWFATLEGVAGRAAAFDTRVDAPALVTGRASKRIARLLRDHGFTLVAEPESFIVTKDNHLEPFEEARARTWGAEIAAALLVTP